MKIEVTKTVVKIEVKTGRGWERRRVTIEVNKCVILDKYTIICPNVS
jgi:hypothetical protein